MDRFEIIFKVYRYTLVVVPLLWLIDYLLVFCFQYICIFLINMDTIKIQVGIMEHELQCGSNTGQSAYDINSLLLVIGLNVSGINF